MSNIKKRLPLKHWIWLITGIIAVIVGIYCALLWSHDRSVIILAVPSVGLLPGGLYVIFRSIKAMYQGSNEMTIIGNVSDGDGRKQDNKKPNVLMITVHKDGDKYRPGIVEFVNKNIGSDYIPQQFLNDGNYYYVCDNDSNHLVLPEPRYFTPTEMAKVLRMDAQKESPMFKSRPTMLENLAPGALVIAIVILAILQVASGG